MDLLALIRRFPSIVALNNFDDDLFDRLNSSDTVAILTVFAIIVTNRQFSDDQIKCWVPAQFSVSYERYVNQICFITNSYSFDLDESFPDELTRRHEHELKYYQWTPFILLLMALLFYVPRQLWRGLTLRSGVDLKDLIEAGQTYRSSNIRQEEKVKLLEYLTNWLNNYCSNTYRLSTPTKRQGKTSRAKVTRIGHDLFFPSGNSLVISYLFVKFVYLFNSIGQILLLNALLGRRFWSYGIELLSRSWSKQIGILQTGKEYFPKVVFCDFTVREVNHPKESHRYTVQCVLPFNLFNQQIFTYLYFWLLILSFFNAVSIILWFYRLSPLNNFHYLERRLSFHFLSDEQTNEQQLRDLFVYQYLQGDGAFILRLITENVNDYVCTKIVLELFNKFCTSILMENIGRQALFQPITQNQSDETMDNHQHQTTNEQTVAVHTPTIQNPRQGKLFIENDILPGSSSDISTSEHQPETQTTVSFSIPLSPQVASSTLGTSPLPSLKETHPSAITETEDSDQLVLHQNTATLPESDPLPSALSLLLPSSTTKGPSPYATTYLITSKRNEHELPDIDENVSTGSTSDRSNKILLIRQPHKTINTRQQENLLSRRIHHV